MLPYDVTNKNQCCIKDKFIILGREFMEALWVDHIVFVLQVLSISIVRVSEKK